MRNRPTLFHRLRIAARRAYLNRVVRASSRELEHLEHTLPRVRAAIDATIRRSERARLELLWLDINPAPISRATARPARPLELIK